MCVQPVNYLKSHRLFGSENLGDETSKSLMLVSLAASRYQHHKMRKRRKEQALQ